MPWCSSVVRRLSHVAEDSGIGPRSSPRRFCRLGHAILDLRFHGGLNDRQLHHQVCQRRSLLDLLHVSDSRVTRKYLPSTIKECVELFALKQGVWLSFHEFVEVADHGGYLFPNVQQSSIAHHSLPLTRLLASPPGSSLEWSPSTDSSRPSSPPRPTEREDGDSYRSGSCYARRLRAR